MWRQWRDVLGRLGFDSAALDAKRLTSFALGLSDLEIATREGEAVDEAGAQRVVELLQRRLTGESVARIVGEREFYGLAFGLNAATLEPRPETEMLVDLAIAALPGGGRLLDLGTGTGAIAIAVLVNRPDATALATDLSAEALAAASGNAARHGVEDKIAFLQGSWFEPVGASPHPNPPLKGEGTPSSLGQSSGLNVEPKPLPLEGRGWGGGKPQPDTDLFDLIISNPPYITSAVVETLAPEVRDFDPRLALDGGPDGLAPYRIIAAEAARYLSPGGRVLVEIGYDQGAAVTALFVAAGFGNVAVHRDLAGLDRVISAHHINGITRTAR
nr:peptide chain release factor N(5)-glutamine methyltransferase [Devosia sp.]